MLPQSCKSSHDLCLNNFFQVFSIGNQRYQVTLFSYINQTDELSHLVRGRKVRRDVKYLIRSGKRAAEAVGIWTEENWDVKRVYLFYTMVSWRLNFKINSRFDSLNWSLVVSNFYTRRGYSIGEFNEEQEQAWQARKKKR